LLLLRLGATLNTSLWRARKLAVTGPFVFSGQVTVRHLRGDHMLGTPAAALRVGVSPATIRSWRHRGWLATQGLDERGRPLHTEEALRAAERRVRENGLKASGIDPRRLRRAA